MELTPEDNQEKVVEFNNKNNVIYADFNKSQESIKVVFYNLYLGKPLKSKKESK